MFRQGPTRQGSVGADLCGFSNSGAFCDVTGAAYYADAVNWMVAQGITNGITDLLYGPNENLTRAQMVTFLWREAGEPTGFAHHGFSDVPSGAYCADAVRWAKATGITTGTSPTAFAPNQNPHPRPIGDAALASRGRARRGPAEPVRRRAERQVLHDGHRLGEGQRNHHRHLGDHVRPEQPGDARSGCRLPASSGRRAEPVARLRLRGTRSRGRCRPSPMRRGPT